AAGRRFASVAPGRTAARVAAARRRPRPIGVARVGIRATPLVDTVVGPRVRPVVLLVQATVAPLIVASPSAAHIRSDLGIRLPHLPLSARSATAAYASPTIRIIEPWSTGSHIEVSRACPPDRSPSRGAAETAGTPLARPRDPQRPRGRTFFVPDAAPLVGRGYRREEEDSPATSCSCAGSASSSAACGASSSPSACAAS